ncbi:hypothetical protein SAMN05421779_104104 [Insolitispirillum peregrinum]|uniref:Uncharacterized protein n=1 Tax=Insolitispirillum peregrinum TaxID=80876 RepID=A0A1N7MGF7_9PROT|nr:hypothetical protein SAMN05421779_104104 [Insolitispirillum peregrinum]
MEEACYGKPHGPLVTPEEFILRGTSLYNALGIVPYCPSCDEPLFLHAVHSLRTSSSFHHRELKEGIDPLDDCVLAARNARLKSLEPDGWDFARGQRIRELFFEDTNLRYAYAFCLSMCRKGNLPVPQWQKMLQRADQKKIWCYAGIKVWAIPYILLSLENFRTRPSPQKLEYGFHFILHKPRGSKISSMWGTSSCTLKKVFSDSGNEIAASDNPYPVTAEAMIQKAGDTSWIPQALLRSLKPPS